MKKLFIYNGKIAADIFKHEFKALMPLVFPDQLRLRQILFSHEGTKGTKVSFPKNRNKWWENPFWFWLVQVRVKNRYLIQESKVSLNPVPKDLKILVAMRQTMPITLSAVL